MRKGITFVSAVLTTFVLAMVAGVTYAYKGMTASNAVSQPPAVSQPVTFPLIASDTTTLPDVTPQDAVSIATKYLNRTDPYSIELANFNNVQTYKVTFSSGDMVYVAMKGQVLAAQPPPPSVVVSSAPRRRGGGGNSGGGGGQGEHDGGHDD